MKTIINNVKSSQIINKSEFITYLEKVSNVEEAKNVLVRIKKEHPKATHHVCCYVVGSKGEIGHAGDDGEPSGTAALPIMDVFKHNDVTNFICVVVRYFGGIKLGAGGLVRAYSSSASMALKEAGISDIKEYVDLKIEFSYSLTGLIEKELKNIEITNKEFNNNVTFKIHLLKEEKDLILDNLKQKTNNQIIIK